MSPLQTIHTADFQTALEQVSIIAQLFDSGVEYDDIINEAQQRTNWSAETAALRVYLLAEACGCVISEELGMQLSETVTIQRGEHQEKISTDESDDFLAAFFLAEQLRYGERNNLFTKIVSHSSFNDVLCKSLEENPDKQLADLKGSTFSFHIQL